MEKGDNTTFTDGFQDTNISIYLSIVNGEQHGIMCHFPNATQMMHINIHAKRTISNSKNM